MGVDLELVLCHAGQLGRDRDPVAAGVEVHGRETGSGGGEGTRETVHLLLEAAQLAEGVGTAGEAEGTHAGHGSFLPGQDQRPRLVERWPDLR